MATTTAPATAAPATATAVAPSTPAPGGAVAPGEQDPAAQEFAALLAGLVPTPSTPPSGASTPGTPGTPGTPSTSGPAASTSTDEPPGEDDGSHGTDDAAGAPAVDPGAVLAPDLTAVLPLPVYPVSPLPAVAPVAPGPDATRGQSLEVAPSASTARDPLTADAPTALTATASTDADPTPATPATPDAVTTPVLSTVSAAAPGAAPATSTTSTTAPAPVSQQLFDRLEELATSAGSSTHRMTVRLDPGTLGEVRVHLSVRDGQVTVRLSAGSAARDALTQGAPALQRLLEGAKGAGTQVTIAVHDLPAGHPAQAVAAALAGSATGDPGQPGPWADPHQDQATGQATPDLLDAHAGGEWTGTGAGQPGDPGAHAGTRRATTARDGDQDRVEGPASVEPGTTRPRRGVDVRM